MNETKIFKSLIAFVMILMLFILWGCEGKTTAEVYLSDMQSYANGTSKEFSAFGTLTISINSKDDYDKYSSTITKILQKYLNISSTRFEKADSSSYYIAEIEITPDKINCWL